MDEPIDISDAERIKAMWQQIANLEQANEQLNESRQKLVADISAERSLYETVIKRLEIQNKALNERMQPFLKQEEANTAAGQLREWNKFHKNKTVAVQPKQPKQQQKQKRRTRRYVNKEHQVLNSVPITDSVATHLL